MMSIRSCLPIVLALAIAGCGDDETHRASADRGDDETIAASTPEIPTEAIPANNWESMLGKRVRLEGVAIDMKVGAFLRCEGGGLFVDLPGIHWPVGVYHGGDEGERVRVTGTVQERHDLPVYIEDPEDPEEKSGMPVPEGTDLFEAGKRYILVDVEWELLQNGD